MAKKNDKKRKRIKIPKNVQQVIPYTKAYKNGIIETSPGYFVQTFTLGDTDFRTTSEEEQDKIFNAFGQLINGFGSDMLVQFTINNKQINKKDFEKTILTPMKGDDNDEWRKEHNEILKDKLKEGRSNMRHEKYMTVSLQAESVDEATQRFSKLKGQLNKTLKKITRVPCEVLTLTEYLSLLYDLLNRKPDEPFYRHADIDEKDTETFTYRSMKKQALTTKDYIAPMSMEFKANYLKLEDKYAAVMTITHFPTRVTSDMLADITDLPEDMVISLGLVPIDLEEGIKKVQKQLTKVKKDVSEAQQTATKNGYSTELISEKIKSSYEDAEIMMGNVTEGDQKLFLLTILVCVYADSKEDVEKACKSVESTAKRYLCDFKILTNRQMIGYRDVLPLCNFELPVNSLRTTEQASVFLPFSTEEFSETGGFYYGLHALSRNMLIINRKTSKTNSNGIILGMPGSGKSFAAKREMIDAILCTDDYVYIIDPQGEYSPLVKALHGEEVEISATAGRYLNPLDMDIGYADSGDPVRTKADYLCSICEIAIGSIYGLSSEQKSIILRSTRLTYDGYMKHMADLRKRGDTRTIDKDAMPTLPDFYEVLLKQDEDEALHIAKALEYYTDDSFDAFSRKTNVNPKNRVVSFNISGMEESIWEFGLTVCLNTMWNQLIENHKRGKRTWIYFDEFHLLTRLESSAKITGKLWKMARKWGGIPTGITQNVEDLLESADSRKIINTSAFVYMLEQAPADAMALQELFHISDTQLEYLNSGGNGVGLIWNGKSIIPFEDKFPTDTKLYKLMSTKPEDFAANFM